MIVRPRRPARADQSHTEITIPATEVSPIESPLYGEAARIITDALLHDPGWLAVGPGNTAPPPRWWPACTTARRSGSWTGTAGPSTAPSGTGGSWAWPPPSPPACYPPPARTFFSYVPGFLLAGPRSDSARPPGIRGAGPRPSAGAARVPVVPRGGPGPPAPGHRPGACFTRCSRTPGRPSTWTPTTPPTSPTTRASASRRLAAATPAARRDGCGL